MPSTIREKISRCMGWVVLVCLFNAIIDSHAPQVNYFRGDLEPYNDIESIYEWVMEEVADVDDAVPEPDNENSEDSCHKSSTDWLGPQRIALIDACLPSAAPNYSFYLLSLVCHTGDKPFQPPRIAPPFSA